MRKLRGKVKEVAGMPSGFFEAEEPPPPVHKKRMTIMFSSTRGALMGDPMTKSILTASSITAWFCSRRGFTDVSLVNEAAVRATSYKVRPPGIIHKSGKVLNGEGKPGEMFACCGDDHTAVASLELCLLTPKFQESMGYQISWDKYRISKKYVHYCQGFGFHPKYRAGIALDSIKIRLLNQFQKTGQQTFEFPDCLVGKAKELWRSLGKQADSDYPDIKCRDYLYDVIPFALKTGMPGFFENKILKDPISYFPPSVGGLGIPSRFEYKSSPEWRKLMLYHQAVAEHPQEMIDEKRSGPSTTWSRSLEFQTNLVNFIDVLGGDVSSVKDSGTIFSETESLLTPSQASSAPSKRRIWKEISRTMIDISKPQALIGTKEAVYSEHYSGQTEYQCVQRLTRARHKIRDLRRQIRKTEDLVNSFYPNGEIIDLPLDKRGMWVNRKDLQAWLGVAHVVPNLFWKRNYFEGKALKYDIDVEDTDPELSPIIENETESEKSPQSQN
jgi:hypothetical protein